MSFKFLSVISVFLALSANIFAGSIITPQKQEVQPKTYTSLVNTLGSSPSGEHAFYLGVLYLNGAIEPDENNNTLEKNTKLAIKFFDKSIFLGYTQATQIVGTFYLTHGDLKKIPGAKEKAYKLIYKAMDNNLYDATPMLAQSLLNDHKAKEALRVLELGAENNIAAAQLSLAIIYQYGLKDKDFSIDKSENLANILLSKACTNKKSTDAVKDFCSSKYILTNEVKQ
jgi:TPR repeat protein